MKRFVQVKLWPVAIGALLLMAAAGCGRDTVKVYHVDASDSATPVPPPVAANTTPPVSMPAAMPDGLPAPDHSGLPTLQYNLPAGWDKKVPTQMRVASFVVSQDGKQADVSVIPLGGMTGADPANVNRWRGQVGLAALPDADISNLGEKVSVGDQPADLYDLTGTVPGGGEAQRILGVILHRDETAWFFKMTGEAGLVEQQKPTFIAFLKTVSFGAPVAAPPTMDFSQLPPSHPPIAGTSLGTQNSLVPNANTLVMGGSVNNGKPIWTIPAGWQEGPLAQFLVAKYVIAGADGAAAAVNVSSLTGDGGGLLANVNRWRAQLGLAPVAEADLANLPTIDASGGKATLIEFSGTDGRTGKPAKLVGVVLPLGGQTWFYKLMGDESVVARQKDALIQFVQSAKYPDAH
jgi:hypothetical protein